MQMDREAYRALRNAISERSWAQVDDLLLTQERGRNDRRYKEEAELPKEGPSENFIRATADGRVDEILLGDKEQTHPME